MTTAAASVMRYSRFFRQSRADRVLDYGAGTLRNALFLARHGFTVYAADLPEQVKKQRGRPDAKQLAGVLDVSELDQSRLGVDLGSPRMSSISLWKTPSSAATWITWLPT